MYGQELVHTIESPDPSTSILEHLAFAYTLLRFEWGWRFSRDENGVAVDYTNLDEHQLEDIQFYINNNQEFGQVINYS